MGEIFDVVLAQPMGFIMNIAYQLIPSYLFSIFVLTLVIKLLMYPLGVRTQKSQIKQMRVKPREAEIRKKYANEKEKMNAEVMALYKSEGVSMTGGCLPLLLQLPIIWALYSVINSPLKFILGYTADQIETLGQIFSGASQIILARSIPNVISGVMEKVAHAVAHPLPAAIGESVIGKAQETAANVLKIIPADAKTIDFNIFGISLADTPSFNVLSVLWLIPLLSAGTALIQMLYTQRHNPMTLANSLLTPGQEQKQPGGKLMMWMSPLLSLWITFTLPAGIGMYWTLSNGFSLLQAWLLNKRYDPHKALQEIKEEMARAPKKKKKKKVLLAPQVADDDMYDASPGRVRLAPVNADDDDMYDASPDRAREKPKKALPKPAPAVKPEPEESPEPKDDDEDDEDNLDAQVSDTDGDEYEDEEQETAADAKPVKSGSDESYEKFRNNVDKWDNKGKSKDKPKGK